MSTSVRNKLMLIDMYERDGNVSVQYMHDVLYTRETINKDVLWTGSFDKISAMVHNLNKMCFRTVPVGEDQGQNSLARAMYFYYYVGVYSRNIESGVDLNSSTTMIKYYKCNLVSAMKMYYNYIGDSSYYIRATEGSD